MKINKSDKPLAILIKEKVKTQIISVNAKGTSLQILDIKQLIIEYYEQLYADKFYNLEEMTNSLKDTNYQNKDIENLSNPVKHRFVILNFPAKKTINSDDFTAEFSHKHLREN